MCILHLVAPPVSLKKHVLKSIHLAYKDQSPPTWSDGTTLITLAAIMLTPILLGGFMDRYDIPKKIQTWDRDV